MVEVRLDIQEDTSANPEVRTTQVVVLTGFAGLSMTELPESENGMGPRYILRVEIVGTIQEVVGCGRTAWA